LQNDYREDRMTPEELKRVQLAIHDLVEREDYENALPVIYSVLEEHPNDAATLHFLGYIWLTSGKEAFAYQMFRRALQEAPNNHAIWTSLGRAAHELDMPQEAINCFWKSAELRPDYAMAYSNASATLVQLSDWDGAQAAAQMALECDPKDLNAQLNLAHCYLAKGDWQKGWAEWNKSLGGKFRKEWSYGDESRWDGRPRKRLVIYGEQGLGDEIFYASCIPDAINISSKVWIDCDPKLEGLFQRSFPKAEVHGTRRDSSPDWVVDAPIQARCAIGGLPEFFRKSDKDFPAKPYLVADPDRRVMWRALFDSWKAQGIEKVIGITTHGGTKLTNQKGRNILPEDLQPLLKSKRVKFVSLNYRGEPIDGVAEFPFATRSEDYDDTAALLAELDMVVGVNTTALHCAAALGVKTWFLVPKHHQWRYAYHSMLWYPHTRLIMQGDRAWAEVIEQVAGEL
jgi:tetratricopeptide (TPR) repeat protein